jgi:hypothetical protein
LFRSSSQDRTAARGDAWDAEAGRAGVAPSMAAAAAAAGTLAHRSR